MRIDSLNSRHNPPATFLTVLLILFCSWMYCVDISAEQVFIDVTKSAGIEFEHTDGRSGKRLFNEFLGSGGGFFDYDGDGDIDIYLVNGAIQIGKAQGKSPHNVLYRNNGNGTFTDVTKAAGVGSTSYGTGATVGDYDNDGDIDLYVTNFGADQLYQNQGDGTFKDITVVAGVGNLESHLPPFLYAVCVGVCVYRNKLESLMGYGRIPPYKPMSVKNRQGGILMKYTLSWVHPRKIITGFRKVFNGVCIKKPTLRNFYLMLQAVCVAPSFRIQSIASHLPIRVKHDKSKQKRVLRFIDTYFPVAAVKGAWLSHIVVSVCRSVGMQHLLVLIDETDLPGGWKAIVAALPFRNRAIPLYWVLYKNEMLKDGTYQGHNDLVQQFCCDVHSRVVKVLGDSREPVLVFDRGFARARAILKFFEGQGICYLIRVPRNVGVRIAGNKQCLEEVANGFYPQVLYHYTEQVPVALYVGGQHTKKDPLYLISNRLQGNPLRTCYKRRTQIEHGFRDLKTNFGFKALVLRKNEQPRMEVLFLLAVVAYGLAFLCYEKAADRWAKTLHPTRKVYSVISVINRMIREVWTQEALLLFTERTCLRDINFLTAEELT